MLLLEELADAGAEDVVVPFEDDVGDRRRRDLDGVERRRRRDLDAWAGDRDTQ